MYIKLELPTMSVKHSGHVSSFKRVIYLFHNFRWKRVTEVVEVVQVQIA